MKIEEIIERLELKTQRLLVSLPKKVRLHFKNIDKHDARGLLLYGPRGTGKTTYLLKKIRDEDERNGKHIFYISGDDPLISTISLYELVEEIFLQGYNGVIIDEVHYLNKWSVSIKSLYDSYPDKKIWISDSSSVVLRSGIADLSRRFIKVRMPLLSFREYLHFTNNIEIDKIDSPFNFDKEKLIFQTKNIDILRLFKDYSSSGTRPFFLEGNFSEKMKNIMDKALYSDIPFFLKSIKENHLKLMKAIVGYLIFSKIPTINIERMCKEWNLSKNKLYELLAVMEESELINIVNKEKNYNLNSKGKKIFLSDPSYYHIYNGEKGNFREAFVVSMLKEKSEIFATKDEKIGDFVWNGIKIEVGGRSKKAKSADFVIRDNLDLPIRNKVPLWICGLLW